jgi:uncharacterized protein YhaN
MRITRCHIHHYGAYRDRLFENLDHPVVTVLGSNEAGKSTFAHFLRVMLYGFHPASQDNFPYMLEDGSAPSGELHYTTDDGPAVVQRRLMSQARSDLHRNGTIETIGNGELPVVRHVPRRVFGSIFALSLQDMASVQSKAWLDVQDRLLVGLGQDHIVSPRDVAASLATDMTRLWRSADRGNFRAKEIREGIRRVSLAVRETLDAEKSLRDKRGELAECQSKIDQFTSEIRALKERHALLRRLIPARALIDLIDRLEAEAGDLSSWADIPQEPLNDIDRLRADIEALNHRRDEIAQIIEKDAETEGRFTEADREILSIAQAIEALMAARPLTADRCRRRESEGARIRDLQRAWDEKSGSMLTRPLTGREKELLAALPVEDLQLRIDALENAVRECEESARGVADTEAAAEGALLLPAAIAAGAGLVLLMVAAIVAVPWLVIVALVLMVTGGVAATAAYRRGKAAEARIKAFNLEDHRRNRSERLANVHLLLKAFPLPETVLEQPKQSICTYLAELRRFALEINAAAGEVEGLSEEIEKAEAAERALVEQVYVVAPGEAGDPLGHLSKWLDDARDRQSDANIARRSIENNERQLLQVEIDRSARSTALEQLEEKLAVIGNADVRTGAEILARRRDAARQAVGERSRLIREFGPEEGLRAEVEALDVVSAGDELSACGVDIEEMETLLGSLMTLKGGLSSEIARLEETPSVDVIEGERTALAAELEQIHLQRDRLAILEQAVRVADERFRRKHQPDVIKRAGEYLARFTDGRYEALALEGESVLHVYERGRSLPVLVRNHRTEEELRGHNPLSSGTLDQIYLALRLAIADHIDHGSARLPLFLDEVFVNWDANRRRAALAVLRELGDSRQIFLFTCHAWFAEELMLETGSPVIDLAPNDAFEAELAETISILK